MRELVEQLGGAVRVASLTNVHPDTIRRYMAGSQRPKPEWLDAVQTASALDAQMPKPATGNTPEKPRGLARADGQVPPAPGAVSGEPAKPRRRIAPPTLPKLPKLDPADAKPLTDREAGEIRDILIEAVREGFGALDVGVQYTNKRRQKPQIWALDDDEAAVIADEMLKLGKRSVVAANVARQAFRLHGRVKVLAIILPRVWMSTQWYEANGGFAL